MYSKSKCLVCKKKEYQAKAKIKQKQRIVQESSKQKELKKELYKVYEKFQDEKELICEGCGCSHCSLSHSHIIKRSLRKDLITDPDNIHYHCFGSTTSCHEKWESNKIEDQLLMLDFSKNLSYIYSKDLGLFQKHKQRLLEFLNKEGVCLESGDNLFGVWNNFKITVEPNLIQITKN